MATLQYHRVDELCNESVDLSTEATVRMLIFVKLREFIPIRFRSVSGLDELSQTIYNKTHTDIPNAQHSALEGESADAARRYLTNIKKPAFPSPVKEIR